MNNRFLERLQIGLVGLQKNPSDQEVAGIPRSSFEIFVKIFRNGLPPEIEKTLPSHNLADKEYLRILAVQVDSFLQKPAPEIEKTLSNMPPIKSLELAFDRAVKGQAEALTSHRTWQTTFEQQAKQWNLNLIARLDQRLQKEFPSLAGPENAGKRKILVADMAQTVQNQGLPAIKGDYKTQTESVLKEVAAKTIRQYATEIEDLQTEQMESKPQAREEKINAVSEIIAQEEAEPAFIVRRGQIRAETLPTKDPTYKVTAAVRTSVIANLPPELAENEEVVNTITGEIEMQIHQGPQDVSQIVQNVLVRKNVQRKIAAAKIAFSAEAQQNFLNAVSGEIEPVINEVSTRVAETPFGGSGASFTPGPAVAPPMPPPASAAITPPIIPPTAPIATVTSPTSGGISKHIFDEGTLGDTMNSSGAPLHLFTALASPRGIQDLGKWIVTLGPIRAPIGFMLDSFPGMPKLNYFHVGMMMMDTTRSRLLKKEAELKILPSSYENQKLLAEVQGRLSIVNQMFGTIDNNPLLKNLKEMMYGGAKTPFGLGIYNVLHPLETVQMIILSHDHLIGSLLFSDATTIFSGYFKYGYFGGNMMAGNIAQQMGMIGVKWALTKIGLYEVVGAPGSRHFVFKPLHKAQLLFQQGVSATAKYVIHGTASLLSKTAAGKAVVAGITKIAAWIGTRLGSLVSVVASWVGVALLIWDAAKIIWAIIKKWAKWTIIAIGALLVWLFGNFSPLEAIGSLSSGFLSTYFFFHPLSTMFGPLFWPVDFIMNTVSSALTIKGIKGILGIKGPIEAVPGDILSSLNNFASGLLNSFSGALSGLAGMAFPVLVTTGSLLAGGYFYMTMLTSSAFWLPTQLPQLQSSYFDVKKSVSFSGKLGEPIKYTLLVNVKVEKKDAKLINIKISDKTDFSCANTPPVVAERTFTDKIPANITLTSPLSIDYEVPTDNTFNDCLITNTATVTADVENGPAGETSFYSASLTIGNPPFEYPSGWPLTIGCVSQGPSGSESHSGDQAIDIGAPTPGGSLLGADVLATHKGTVSLAFRNHGIYGNYIIVDGSGDKAGFQSLYAHLQTISVTKGQVIARGTKLGTVGSTGRSTGPHLHYEFRGLKMGTPYLPVSVPACVGREICKICF